MFIINVVLVLVSGLLITELYALEVPDLTLEAYKPKGFKISVPATNGLQLFAFHGNVNKDINQVNAGEIQADIRSPENNYFTRFLEDVQLKVGDEISYWIFIQKDKLGYKLDRQKWTVTELLEAKDPSCIPSETVVLRKSVICRDSVVFEDNFNNDISDAKWTIEHFIPVRGPDYEFVSYQNIRTVVYTLSDILNIKPKAVQDKDIRRQLDLRNGCTRSDEDECNYTPKSAFIAPPVTSGRIVSKFNFRYGKIEIKAKLPGGDWIFPQIYLEELNNPNHKLVITYARGNAQLTASSGQDIGSRLWFGGPVLTPDEPGKSNFLLSKRNSEPFSQSMHKYSVFWSKDKIEFFVDDQSYGAIEGPTLQQINFGQNSLVALVLGVGVGGNNDFPDNSRSGTEDKPWMNKERTQTKKFFDKRHSWISTWGEQSALQVDYVKITAL